MLSALMLMVVLPLFAVFSAHACDDMTLFEANMTDQDQSYVAESGRHTQTQHEGDGSADGAAALGDDGAHITFARPNANVTGSLAATAGSIGDVSTVTLLTAADMDEAASKLPAYGAPGE